MKYRSSLRSKRVLAQPFGVSLCAIEARAGFVQLVLALKRSGSGALQQAGDLGMGERLERADGFNGLIEDALTIYASDLDRDRQVHTVMECFNRCHRVAAGDVAAAECLHPEGRDAFAIEYRQHFALEAAEVPVHYIEWHLDRVEVEFVLPGEVEHA